jgi:hypothetical protein
MQTINRNTKAAQTIKLEFHLQAAQGQPEALLIWADFLEDNGSKTEAARVRRDYRRYGAMEGLTIDNETWLIWHAKYVLSLLGERFLRGTSFKSIRYRGNRRADRSMMADDNSLEYAIVTSKYVPTLSRSSERETNLGRVLEALGYAVFWIA